MFRANATSTLFVALLLATAAACSSSSGDDDASPSTGGTSNGTAGTSGSGNTGTETGGSTTGGSAGAEPTDDAGAGATGGSTSAAGAGAVGGSAGTSDGVSGTAGNGDGSSGTGSGGDAGTAGAPAEPPYANVTAVAATGSSGSYTFNVTVESADIDCSQYANWWEVLTPDGALVYRRILDHSHTDANGTSDPDAPGNTFTRSGGPVPVAESDVVVVRAHMSTGGYNGAVMRGTVTEGFVQAPEIGSDFAADVETLEPQPTSCEF